MLVQRSNKYQVKIEIKDFLTDVLDCEERFASNLDPIGFVKCKILGKIIEIVIEPPNEITEEYLFSLVEETLEEIGSGFVKATLRLFVGNAARTLVASATGGALGSKAGPVGVLIGLVGGAVIEKALFDWKDLCQCTHDEFGYPVIQYFGDVRNE